MSATKTNTSNQVGNMDQIRELMFGPQVRMFEEEISKVNATMESMSATLSEKLEKLEAKLTTEHENSLKVIEQKIKSLNNAMQEENIDFKEQLVKNEKKANQALDDMQEVFETQINVLKNDHNQSKNSIANDLERLKNSVSKLLNEQIENMQNTKVSKDDLSAMLLEFAMKVSDSSIEGNLESMMPPQQEQKK